MKIFSYEKALSMVLRFNMRYSKFLLYEDIFYVILNNRKRYIKIAIARGDYEK